MTRIEIVVLWTAAYFGVLVGLVGRIGYLLFAIGEQPPEDPSQVPAWQRRRRWLTISELAASPAMATGWTSAAIWWPLPAPLMVLGCMMSGALGFGFLLHALQIIISKRIGNA